MKRRNFGKKMVYGGELLMSLAVVFGFMHLARLKFMVYYVLGLVISKSVSSNDIASSSAKV